MIKVSEVFLPLFLRGIQRLSGVTLDKLSPCPDKTETHNFSFQTYIYEGFFILGILLDKLVLGIDLDLLTVFYVSVL